MEIIKGQDSVAESHTCTSSACRVLLSRLQICISVPRWVSCLPDGWIGGFQSRSLSVVPIEQRQLSAICLRERILALQNSDSTSIDGQSVLKPNCGYFAIGVSTFPRSSAP